MSNSKLMLFKTHEFNYNILRKCYYVYLITHLPLCYSVPTVYYRLYVFSTLLCEVTSSIVRAPTQSLLSTKSSSSGKLFLAELLPVLARLSVAGLDLDSIYKKKLKVWFFNQIQIEHFSKIQVPILFNRKTKEVQELKNKGTLSRLYLSAL